MAKLKNAKPNIPYFEPIGHLYHTADGMVLDSVTTILKAELSLYQFSSQDAANRGTKTHKACHYFDDDDLNEASLDREVGAYFSQYKAAKSALGFIVLANELIRFHPVYLFAGTTDKIVIMPTEKGLEAGVMDLKTTKTLSVEEWHRWQTAGYFDMVKNEYRSLIYKGQNIPFTGRWGLYLSPDAYRLVRHDGKNDFGEFLALTAAHNIKLNSGYRKRKCETPD